MGTKKDKVISLQNKIIELQKKLVGVEGKRVKYMMEDRLSPLGTYTFEDPKERHKYYVSKKKKIVKQIEELEYKLEHVMEEES